MTTPPPDHRRLGANDHAEDRPANTPPSCWTEELGKKVTGDGGVDTHTPMGSMVFTVMVALARMELEIMRERITDSVTKRRATGKDRAER